VLWQIINKEVRKFSQTEQKIELKSAIGKNNKITKVTEMLNSFFSGIADELLNQNSRNYNCQMLQQKINCCANTIFIFPVQ
jgi:hypothetical protein